MDAFLNQSNYFILYKWFKNHLSRYDSEKSDKWALSLFQTNEKYKVYVHFYRSGVIEQLIKDAQDNSVLYYIHFQFLDFLQSTSLLYEFLNFLQKLNQNKKRIMICCSCGFTSSLFQEGIQKIILENKMNMDVSACDISSVKEKFHDYDLILLTPQVSYYKPELMKIIGKKIITIPTTDFACHNYANILSIIHHYFEKETDYEKNIISM